MNVLDRSNYFKGLLILAIKDNVVVEQEENLLMDLGSKLGFEKKFCHNAIQQSLGNEYLTQTPPVFSRREIAEYFLLDGLKFAISDNNLDPYELQWLNLVAESNKIEKTWLSNKLKMFISTNNGNKKYNLFEHITNITYQDESIVNMDKNISP